MQEAQDRVSKMAEFIPPVYLFASISVAALILLGMSFVLAVRLMQLMGKGKDTATVKILMITIIVNGILGLYSASAIYWKYVHEYVNYVRNTDIVLLAIGLILVVSIFKVYIDYARLIKRNEPGE